MISEPTNGNAANNDPLRTDFNAAVAACKAYEQHLSNGFNDNPPGHTCYLLRREDIDELLNLGGEPEMDGIRIYIGHVAGSNGPLVRLYMVGCRNTDGVYEDQLPATNGAATSKSTLLESTSRTLLSGRPCPSECGGTRLTSF